MTIVFIILRRLLYIMRSRGPKGNPRAFVIGFGEVLEESIRTPTLNAAKGGCVRSDVRTMSRYLDELPEERGSAVAVVRKVILKNLPEGYEKAMNWGGWSE